MRARPAGGTRALVQSVPITLVLVDLVAAAVWTSLWVLLGWVVGDRWRSVSEETGVRVTVGGVAGLALVATPLMMRLWRRRAHRSVR